MILLFLSPFLLGAGGSIYNRVKKGNESFEQKKYDEALQYYKNAQVDDPESPELHYNIGNTLYKVRKYEDAISEFGKVTSPDEPLLEEKSLYNTGVVQYRAGIQEYNQKNYQKAIEWLGKCIESNIAALKTNPDDEDAKFNLEQARRKLKEINAELSKMQQEQQQNQQQQQQQNQSQQTQNQQQNEKSQQAEEKKESETKADEKQKEQQQKESQEEKQQLAQAQESQTESGKEEEKKEQAQLQQMSKEDAERLLQMLSDEEEQKQIYQERHKGGDIYIEKDW